jgi:ketosteroid isomerase-like protein
MKTITTLVVITLLATGCSTTKTYTGSASDRAALEKTGAAIREAFARGDIDAAMAYHHPDVTKAFNFTTDTTQPFSYGKYAKGRDAVRAGLVAGFQAAHFEFIENRTESLLIQGGTAVEQTVFAIKITPKNGEPASVFSGRTVVVYVRYKKSPTGWASIREVIQTPR